mmetsp:Transcript_17574/g.30771  ORF Transcript_17574/g.30771 Transcript_17574/m.30771 type:complete len:206 (+) Transcript_17574:221-838(+)
MMRLRRLQLLLQRRRLRPCPGPWPGRRQRRLSGLACALDYRYFQAQGPAAMLGLTEVLLNRSTRGGSGVQQTLGTIRTPPGETLQQMRAETVEAVVADDGVAALMRPHRLSLGMQMSHRAPAMPFLTKAASEVSLSRAFQIPSRRHPCEESGRRRKRGSPPVMCRQLWQLPPFLRLQSIHRRPIGKHHPHQWRKPAPLGRRNHHQ